MNTKPRPQQGLDSIVLMILLVASSMLMILLIFVPAPSQAATEPGPDPVMSQAATEPEPEPVTTSDGFADYEPMSSGQCPSGYFCVWSGTNFSGSFAKFSYTASYRAITWSSIKSLWNNRSKRSLLYSGSSGAGSVACYAPGAKTGSLSGWPSTANSLYVGKTENC